MPKTNKNSWVLPPDAPRNWNPVGTLYAQRHHHKERPEQFVRLEACQVYCYWVPTREALRVIGQYGPIISIGSGTCYAENLLRMGGVEVVAVDIAPPPATNGYHLFSRRCFGETIAGNQSEILNHRGHTLMLCWPPGVIPLASSALSLYDGEFLIYVGQESGIDGVTGDQDFHRQLARDWILERLVILPHWERRNDNLMIYRRR